MKLSEYVNQANKLASEIVEAQNAAEDNPSADNLARLSDAQAKLAAFRKENYQTHKEYLDRLTRATEK